MLPNIIDLISSSISRIFSLQHKNVRTRNYKYKHYLRKCHIFDLYKTFAFNEYMNHFYFQKALTTKTPNTSPSSKQSLASNTNPHPTVSIKLPQNLFLPSPHLINTATAKKQGGGVQFSISVYRLKTQVKRRWERVFFPEQPK